MNFVDNYIYHKFYESKYIFLILYIDDIFLASNNIDLFYKTKRILDNNFEMKDLDGTLFVLEIEKH